jgi:hypothetical protein
MKTKFNPEKFSFAEMTSNGNGKTSGSGTMGALICVVGSVCFLLGCIDKMWVSKDIDIITQAIVFTGLGAGLLGLRKYKASTEKSSFAVDGDAELLPKANKPDACTCPDGCMCGNCDKCKG